jgi:polyisoprenyl-phosphate glycosyltransferase
MYNEEAVCMEFFAAVLPVAEAITPDYECICVNDGSSDATIVRLKQAHANNPRIKVIDLSRNFGKEAALSAGLDHTTGDAIVPIDADLQDPPELIKEMVQFWQQGYEIVLGVREDRSSDSPLKRITANAFYRIMKKVGDVPLPANAGDFRLMDRRVVDAIRRLPERTRFMKGLFAWVGFRIAQVPYKRPLRAAGETKWKYWQLWNFALEGIFSFTTMPLKIWTYLGVTIAAISSLYLAFVLLKTAILGIDVPGYASLLSVILFFSGVNMVGLGIIGEYLGRIFLEVKNRPLYIVREYLGFGDQ